MVAYSGMRVSLVALSISLAALSACTMQGAEPAATAATVESDGPADQGMPMPQELTGDLAMGREVFRFETFGNEGFWTDAVRLPAGIMEAGVTPLQALRLGLQVDSELIDAATRERLAAELREDPSGRSSRILNDPAMTARLIEARAVIGMSPRNGKVGATCALCHTMADGSVFRVEEGGSIGRRQDGLANHDLNLGTIFATAANTRALYTVAQTQLSANNGMTLGRAPSGLDEDSTEAEFDAYFSNPRFYPVGMFDDSFDGNGDPMHNTPLFEQDLAAPYGSEGTFTRLDDFSNLVFTTLFDQTMLTTPGGRAFVHQLAGAAGDEMIADYVKILRETNVTGYPYVTATPQGRPGDLATPIGMRVDNRRLLALNAYLASLAAPSGAAENPQAVTRGRQVFRTAGCTGCHNVDQSRPVPTTVHPMARIFPGDRPVTLAQRQPPLNPVVNTVMSFFDDKMAVVNASLRGEVRGNAMPLLLDLARKRTFLHDDSVEGLDDLLSAQRGRDAPHPFYVQDRSARSDVAAYLRSLDTRSR